MTRSAYSLINSCNNWHETVCLDSATKTELLFWRNNITLLNSKVIWDDNIIPSVIVYSDASANACGAILNVNDKIFHTNWSDDERTKSSTWRELQTVYLAIQAFTTDLSNRTIAWFTDNQNVPSIINKGSRVPELQTLALKLFQICLQHLISLEVKWLPREANHPADTISKIVDFDDYTINDQVFGELDIKWGPHTVDRFACFYNTKLPRFNSRFYQIGTEGVDAFTQDWGYANNWLFPPTVLLPRAIRHLQACQAEATLIIPFWKSAIFWTLLHVKMGFIGTLGYTIGQSSIGLTSLLSRERLKTIYLLALIGILTLLHLEFLSSVLLV